MRFTKQQPKDGELILHCGHLDKKPHHFFAVAGVVDGEPVEVDFKRPDGTMGRARWLVICNSCFELHADNPAGCIKADSVWIGDKPAIQVDVPN